MRVIIIIIIIVAGVAVAALAVGGIAIAGARGDSADLENRARTVSVRDAGGVTVKAQQPNSQAGATNEVGDPQPSDDRSGRNDEPDENQAPESEEAEAEVGARQGRNDDRSGRHDEPDERKPDEAGGP